MKRSLVYAALTLCMCGTAQAQTVTSGSASGAAAVLQQYNVIPGGGVGSGSGGTLWTMGQTTGGNSSVSYDACLKNANVTVLFAGVSIPLEIAHCWALRSMDAMAKFPPGSVQYEYGCLDSNWRKVDWDTGTMACTANRARVRSENPNDPRGQAMAYVPVVQAGHGANTQAIVSMNQQVPPTVVSTAATNAAVGPTTSLPTGLGACRQVPGTTFLTC